jgi:hypothetical protein
MEEGEVTPGDWFRWHSPRWMIGSALISAGVMSQVSTLYCHVTSITSRPMIV